MNKGEYKMVYMSEIFENLEDMAVDWREDLKESIRENHGQLGVFVFESIPAMIGGAVSGVSRLVGMPELIAVPPLMDLFFGGIPMFSNRAMNGYLKGNIKYAIGAAIPYADKIYFAACDNLPEVCQYCETLVDKLF